MASPSDISSASNITSNGWRQVQFTRGGKDFQVKVEAYARTSGSALNITQISIAARDSRTLQQTTSTDEEKVFAQEVWESQLSAAEKATLGISANKEYVFPSAN